MEQDNKQLDKERVEFLKLSFNNARDEMKTRIAQRNTFSIQLIGSIGVLLGLGFLDNFKYSAFLFLLIPLVTIYFVSQILYTYNLHDRCHNYLINNIEPELAKILKYDTDDQNKYMWESYCIDYNEHSTKKAGTRKFLFEVTVLVMPLIASVLFFLVSNYEKNLFDLTVNIVISILAFVLYTTLGALVIFKYKDKKEVEKEEETKQSL